MPGFISPEMMQQLLQQGEGQAVMPEMSLALGPDFSAPSAVSRRGALAQANVGEGRVAAAGYTPSWSAEYRPGETDKEFYKRNPDYGDVPYQPYDVRRPSGSGLGPAGLSSYETLLAQQLHERDAADELKSLDRRIDRQGGLHWGSPLEDHEVRGRERSRQRRLAAQFGSPRDRARAILALTALMEEE